jgi:hypothetical protein
MRQFTQGRAAIKSIKATCELGVFGSRCAPRNGKETVAAARDGYRRQLTGRLKTPSS